LLSLRVDSVRQAQKAAPTAVGEQKANAASTTKVIQEPQPTLISQPPASEDGTQPMRADAIIVETANDAVPLNTNTEPSKKPKTREKEKRARAAAKKLAAAALSQTHPTDTATSNPVPVKVPYSKTAWMLRDTGTLVHTIAASSLEPHTTAISSSAGFETLCSYNWQNDGAIFVPGSPPKWTPPILPFKLPPDTGRHFMDQNAHRVPKYPFEPAFQALSIMNPNLNLDTVDIIANRNSFRKLIDFAAGRKGDTWCMGLHLVNDTLFISRKERNATQMIHGAANSGYGHNFEKAFTQAEDEMQNSSSHHRVIRYHIGSLDCVVRFEVDAYYQGPDAAVELDEEVVDGMTKLKIHDPIPVQPAPRPKTAATKVITKGTPIPPSQLAEIKAKRFAHLNDALPQLWFGRTPWFLNGNHNDGKVHSVSIVHAKSEFAAWEEANQERLRKMVCLLQELKNVVKGMHGKAAVLVYDEKGGPVRVFEVKRDGGVLPVEIVKRHWDV
jgi:hypothetical protein